MRNVGITLCAWNEEDADIFVSVLFRGAQFDRSVPITMSKINWKQVGNGLIAGALAGVAGSLALALTDYVERRYVNQSDSATADKTADALGLSDHPPEKPSLSLHAMNFGYGAVAGAIRGAVLGLGFTGIPGKLLYWGTTALSSRTILPALGLKPRLQEKAPNLFANITHQIIYAGVSVVVLGLFKRFTAFDPEVNQD